MKEQIIIDGVREGCEILFECGSVDDLASYDMIKKNIKITPENAPVDDYDIRLIANPHSPYGFSSIFKRNKNVDEWEYMGFGHSGACSVVTALLKQLARKISECEELKRQKTILKSRSKHLEHWKDNLLKENDRYRKALEEIEVTIAALHFRTLPFQQGITHELADRVQYYKNIIRDIISKARGKNDN
jgi:hypothetical protein